MCVGGDGCVGVAISLCVCAKKGGDIHFSKAQESCLPPIVCGFVVVHL